MIEKRHGNLIPPVKGEIRNPKGKAKGTINLSSLIRKIFEDEIHWNKITISDVSKLRERFGNSKVGEALIYVQVSKALTGDTQAFNALRDAGWGRMINVDANATLDVVHIYKPEKLETAQIEFAAEQLRQRAKSAVEAELLNEVDSPTGAADLRPLDS